VTTDPTRVLRLEGLALLVVVLVAYGALGYGLKHPTGFHDTQLGRNGRGDRSGPP
jgi:hypothetical protein